MAQDSEKSIHLIKGREAKGREGGNPAFSPPPSSSPGLCLAICAKEKKERKESKRASDDDTRLETGIGNRHFMHVARHFQKKISLPVLLVVVGCRLSQRIFAGRRCCDFCSWCVILLVFTERGEGWEGFLCGVVWCVVCERIG